MIYYNINMLYKIAKIFLMIFNIHHKSLEIQNFKQIKNTKITHLRNFMQNIRLETLPIHLSIIETKRKNFLYLIQKEMLYSDHLKSIYQIININIIESKKIIERIQLIYASVFPQNSNEDMSNSMKETIFLQNVTEYIYTQIMKMQYQFILLKQEQKNQDIKDLCSNLIIILNLALYLIMIIKIKELSFTECMYYINQLLAILDNNTDETFIFTMFNICYVGINLLCKPIHNKSIIN
jgi:hypothetical protein